MTDDWERIAEEEWLAQEPEEYDSDNWWREQEWKGALFAIAVAFFFIGLPILACVAIGWWAMLQN